MPAPDVSVIIPTHNVREYVATCIDSVIASRECSVEVIVIDDCSADGTVSEIRARYAGDPRVRLHELASNSGPSHARNVGVSKATGEWVAFVDSDDWIQPDRFQRMLRVAIQEGADVISDDSFLIQDGSQHPWSTMYGVNAWAQSDEARMTFERFIMSGLILHPMVRRSFLGEKSLSFDASIRIGEDLLLWSLLLLRGANWWSLGRAGYFHRARRGSLTHGGANAADIIRVNEILMNTPEVLANPEFVDLCKRSLALSRERYDLWRARRAFRDRNLPLFMRILASNRQLIGHMISREARLFPLRINRRWQRLRSAFRR
jgi:glycosyltransferase involved in cell wall biosynthesis